MHWKKLVALAVFVSVVGAGHVNAQEDRDRRPDVQQYSRTGGPSCGEAQAHAADTLRATGIDVRWIRLLVWRPAADRMRRHGAARRFGRDLVLRLQRAQRPTATATSRWDSRW